MIGGSLPENESYFTVGAARDATGPSERGRRDADVREKVTKEATVLIIGVRAPYNADKGRRQGSAARDAIRRFCFYPASPRLASYPRAGSQPPRSIRARQPLSLLPVFHAKSFEKNFLHLLLLPSSSKIFAARISSFRRRNFWMTLACTRMTSIGGGEERRGAFHPPPPPRALSPSTFAVRFEFACQSPLPSNFLHAIARYWNCLVGDLSPSVIYFLNRACLPASLPTCLPTYLPLPLPARLTGWLTGWLPG